MSTPLEDAEPTSSFQYGLTRVNETIANVDHLSNAANITAMCLQPLVPVYLMKEDLRFSSANSYVSRWSIRFPDH